MSRWNLAWLLGITTATLVGLSLSYSAPTRDGTPLQKKHENLRLLVEVLEEVQQKYVKELNSEKMRELVENMVNSGLERLDPHSNFINGDEFKQFQKASKGKFGGVGIRIGLDRGGQLFVETPMVGTPAYEAGIMAGDLIVKVEGKSTENLPLKKAVEMIQGEPGTKITLTVLHEGAKKPVDIEMTRREINIESVLGDRLAENLKQWDFWIDPVTRIGYVRLVAFTETTVSDLTKVVDVLQKGGMKGLIIDLRNNPGGLLRAAVEASSLFLPEGKRVVSTKGRNQKEETFESHPPAGFQAGNYPIAVLINRYSASASEILAAALQDWLRAVIIGERSYGKGSVQNIIPTENGISALKLTTASYWRPSGKNIHRFPDAKDEEEWGVKPNAGFEVKLSDEERLEYFKDRRKRDVIRKPGQESKEEEPAAEEKDKTDKKKEPFKDRVLDKALEYIKGEIQKGGQRGAAPALPPPPPAEAAFDAAFNTPPTSTAPHRHAARRSNGVPTA